MSTYAEIQAASLAANQIIVDHVNRLCASDLTLLPEDQGSCRAIICRTLNRKRVAIITHGNCGTQTILGVVEEKNPWAKKGFSWSAMCGKPSRNAKAFRKSANVVGTTVDVPRM